MRKEKPNEKQLVTDAKRWFEQKYGKTPKECGIKFIKVWHKPTPYKKTTAVVFAQTEEIGKAFIWEQNAIWRSIKNFWILPIYAIVSLFAVFSQERNDEIINTGIICLVPIFFALCLCFYAAHKCKKKEKIHKWDVEIYYP